jgi:RimJ/RimL family protein N-acetyltransferase
MRLLLKNIFFSLNENTIKDEKILGQIVRTGQYLEDSGFEVGLFKSGDEFFDKKRKPTKEKSLVITDTAEDATELSDKGFFCVGVLHDNNKNEKFSGLKYIFSEIEEVDADSFVKVYQRYAGEPWEVIRTDRLIIRETTIEDVDEFYRLYKDPEMTRYMEGLFENPEDEKRYQKDYIEKVYGLMGFGVWTIVRAEDNEVIGRAGYSIRNGFENIELGFLIGKKYQHKGYAFEACSAILEYGKKTLELTEVQALIKKENKISISLIHKLGFSKAEEVTVEENIYGHGYKGYDNPDTVTIENPTHSTYVMYKKTL